MSGKFWGASSEEEEEDFYSSGEEDEEVVTPVSKQAPAPGSEVKKWKKDAAYASDEEDDTKREVKAKTEKANEALDKNIEQMNSLIEAKDWTGISKEITNLIKIAQNWQDSWSVDYPPPRFIGFLAELEDLHKEALSSKDYQKKLSKTNLKAMKTMQQRLRKIIEPYAKVIRTFRFNKKKFEAGQMTEEELYPLPQKAEAPPPEPEKPAEPEKIIWTPQLVDEKLGKILSARGRKGYDRKKQVTKLTKLLENSQNSYQTLQIYLHIVSLHFDSNIASHMGNTVWLECLNIINKIIELISKEPSLVFKDKEKSKETTESSIVPISVKDSLILFLDRLEQEQYKALQDLEASKISAYAKRMKDISYFIDLCDRILEFYRKINDMKSVTKASLLRLKYSHHTLRITIQNGDQKETVSTTCDGLPLTNMDTIENFVKVCFQHGDERQKTHAMLYFISALANRDIWYKARDLMLMSHLQDTIQNVDIETQIIFNRAMAFLGLCAFRAGKISDAHNCLAELCSSTRVRELLAQGVTRYTDKGAEQERLEIRRQVPAHMHINSDLLEAVHLVCALLLEVPNSAANTFDKRKPISRTLRKYLEFTNRQVFNGPPENTREFVVAAAKALSRADWRKCCSLLFSIKVWKMFPEPEKIIQMITERVKEEGLRTYLFIASSSYDSLSMERLSTMFDLPRNKVHSIISKMMINGELHASWDQPTATIVMHKAEPSKLQSLGLQFSEKILSFVDSNERLMDSKSSSGKYDPIKDRHFDTRPRYKPRYTAQQGQTTNQQRQRYQKDTTRRPFRHN